MTASLAIASDGDSIEFRTFFLLFLGAFWLIMVVSSIPRRIRPGLVTPALLRAFAHEHGLHAGTSGERAGQSGSRSRSLQRWLSTNPALKHPDRNGPMFVGEHAGFPYSIDEVSVNSWFGSPWQRKRYLRLCIVPPEIPTTLALRPARLRDRILGRAGLLRSRTTAKHRGGLVATLSKRPIVQARERMFLNDARRQLLEQYQARSDGIHLHDGRLYLIRDRFEITGPELDRLHGDAGALAAALAAAS
ncbi:hypothetical protein ACKVEX_01250 [Rhodocyclaceae bacterium SMB388]